MPSDDIESCLSLPVFRCSLCGAELLEGTGLQTCTYCGIKEEGDWLCPQDHYVCESCRTARAHEIIERVALTTTDPDPVGIAELIMKHPTFSAHGPAHHLVVAPVILAALRNQGHVFKDGTTRTAIHRMEDVPSAVCGTRGDCGACAGLGCAVSLLTGATFRSGQERALALRATAHALMRVAELGGPRCCKQSVYAAIETAAEFIGRELGIPLTFTHPIHCAFSHVTEECKKEDCVFFDTL